MHNQNLVEVRSAVRSFFECYNEHRLLEKNGYRSPAHTRRDWMVSTATTGFIEAIDAEEGELTARFDGRLVIYPFGELDQLAPAYATTVHKAQGSEYPAVVVPLTMRHYPMLRHNLIYTAVTRAKRLLVVVGERRALAVAVKGRRAERRWTKLRERLASGSAALSGPC